MRCMGYLLIAALLTGSAAAQEVYIDNVVVVLDASGSMKEYMRGTGTQKIDAAKEAIKEVLRNTPPKTQVGLLVFGRQRRWEYPLGPRDDRKLFAALDQVEAVGGTPLGEFMKTGTDRLLQARKEQFGYGSYRLLVVTDGEASDQELVNRYTPDIVSRGIVVDVIGVDMRQDHTLAQKVHSYRRANDPESLKQAIREVFAEVGSASDGMAGDSAFEELAGLPSEAASAIIASLVSTGNDPIGSRATAVVSEQRPVQHSGTTSPPPHRKSKKNNGVFVLVVGAMVAVQVLKRLFRKG